MSLNGHNKEENGIPETMLMAILVITLRAHFVRVDWLPANQSNVRPAA